MKIGLAILVFFAVFNLINFKKKVSLHSPKEKIKLKNMHELSGKGEFKIYYENGSIASDGFYKNGLLDGEWKFYSKNGSLERIEKYENGEKIENN